MSYSKVKYIETHNTWFNTGLNTKTETRILCDMEFMSLSGQNLRVVGCNVGYNSTQSIYFATYNDNLRVYVGGYYNDYAGYPSINTRYTFDFNSKTFIWKDKETGDVLASYTPNRTLNESSSNYLWIGNAYTTTTSDFQTGNFRFYEVYIYDGETLVGHYLPYKDNETGYGVLYDTVSGTYISANVPSNAVAGDTMFGPDTDSLNISFTGSTETVNITSENPWTASTTDSWISVYPSTGDGDSSISVTVLPNQYSSANRNGTVTFTDGENTADLAITQKGNTTAILKNLYKDGSKVKQLFYNGINVYRMLQKLQFSVDLDSISFESTGGTQTFNITANDNWSITYPEWVTVSQSSGSSNAQITVTTTGETSEILEGLIVIYCEGKTKEIGVIQGNSYKYKPLTVEVLSDGQIYFLRYGSISDKTFEYSKNGSEWATITTFGAQYDSRNSINVNTGDIIQIRGNYGRLGESSSNYYVIQITSTANVYGNIMSLLYSSFENITTVNNYDFCRIFRSSKIVDASNLILPTTTLANYCYQNMFANCSSLTTVPELPSITLAYGCYWGMFYGCTSLTTAPKLPATTLANNCYGYMFYLCTSLTTAPELSATTLANYCYQNMFANCTNLNNIKCLATNINGSTSYTTNWTNGVASTGTFVKAAGVEWPSGTSGIPNGWTVEQV